MGCDIHLIAEQRYDDNAWITLEKNTWHIARDYALFTRLCGVRNTDHIKPIVDEPRGLPADISSEARAIIEDEADHSYSWLTWDELLEYIPFARSDNYTGSFVLRAYSYEWLAKFSKIRFVFGFDS